MAICPKCKEEIDYLLAYTEKKYTLELNDKEEVVYEEQGEVDYPTSFECPECLEEIFTDEAEAIGFLKEKDELKSLIQDKLEKKNGGNKSNSL